ncbi:Outer membrane protein beta-barrel domain-containing protein [Lishizhenia tianjinensis]|uniref:Outer membrane protein beta-barrel domain-containing protein n=1 Tax=Lishizhenia tianjinensis TaxID=477690 RepID=A0A1I6YYS0_9FLAO|nr:outer membrane beta-barrel protein [Lishizhenia tianjinensis]SFT55577.1 Outer membrane protein beta-barrel domain-containing protein [Lishizhenia tianjinensis]
MKTAISLLAMCFLFTTYAQEEEEKKWHYGFEVGANYSNVIGRDKSNGPGYELGITTQRKIGEQLFFNPAISFGYSSARFQDNPILDYYLNFQPKLNYFLKEDANSVFFSFGPALQHRLSEVKIASDYTNRNNLSLNFGVGFLNKLQYFDLQTELRYSFGLTEKLNPPMLNPDYQIYYHSLGLYIQFL